MKPLAVTTEWQKFAVPIPDPAVAARFTGLFHFAAAGSAYTVWFHDIKYESLDAATLGAPLPFFTTATVNRSLADTVTVTGAKVSWQFNGAPVVVLRSRDGWWRT